MTNCINFVYDCISTINTKVTASVSDLPENLEKMVHPCHIHSNVLASSNFQQHNSVLPHSKGLINLD